MRSYSETDIFKAEELELLRRAEHCVRAVPAMSHKRLRCHELARAVGKVLDLTWQDGYYVFVEHTWLWTRPLVRTEIITARLYFPNILDVYAVGSMPPVRLVSTAHPSLPHVGWAYRPGEKRTDIKEKLVKELARMMKSGVVAT